MKKLTTLSLAAAALLALVGCTSGETGTGDTAAGTEDTGGDTVTIAYSGAIQANPTNKAIEDAMRVKVEELGGEFLATDANLDPGKQYSDVQTLIQQGIDVLVIWPLDPLSIQPALEEAEAAGIPVIVQDTDTGGGYVSNFQMTNFEAGEEAAAMIAEELGSDAKVAQILGIPTVGVLEARNQGFVAGAEAEGLEMLASQLNETDNADGARPIVDAWKSRFGSDLQAIFAVNDPAALGAASAATDDFDPLIIGVNGDIDGVEAVRDGRLFATFDLHPVPLGAGLGWAAFELAKGGTLPETVLLKVTAITADNVDEWVAPAELLKKSFDVKIVEENGEATLVATPVD